MGLSDQLTFYDLVGLIIPGGAVLAPVAWAVLSLNWATWPAMDPLMLAGAALGAAYVLGHLAQLVTRLPGVDGFIEAHGSGHPYEETLLDPALARRPAAGSGQAGDAGEADGADRADRAGDAGGLSPIFHERLAWGLENSLAFPPDLASPEGRREAFGLCYAHIVQFGNPGRIQLFKGLSGFYRGMLTAAVVTVAAGLTTMAVLVSRTPVAAGFTLGAAVGLTLLGASGAILFLRGFHQMDRRFVLAVLRSFYVLACCGAATPSAEPRGPADIRLEPQQA